MRRSAEPLGGRRAATTSLVLASLGVLLAAADTYVVALALPDVMAGVGLDVEQLQRAAPIVSAFLLGYVAVLPLIGRLADLYGRVPVLVGSLLCFSLGCLVTATAADLGTVVTGRFLQGVGGGGLVPATLALVADLWPPQRRGLPLGVVGAVQELGSVVGPLLGAAVLVVADWRAIFWLNLALGAGLAAGLSATGRRHRTGGATARRVDLPGAVLALLAVGGLVLLLVRPAALVDDVTLGAAYVPVAGESRWASPLAVATLGLTAALAVRCAAARTPLVDLRRLPRLVREADVLGALLLGSVLGAVVLSFATADPAVQLIADRAPLLLAVAALALVLFGWRQRVAAHPLVPLAAVGPRPAWGALVVSGLVGAALVVALVDVPVYARAVLTGESQLDAALVLLRLLAVLPIGALLGGWLLRRLPAGPVAATGCGVAAVGLLAMSRWDASALDRPSATLALAATGLGFGLAVAPVNAALLAATPPPVHGVASALLVVARMIGMLVGLSALTAVGLRRFHAESRLIPDPASLCPATPLDCAPYADAVRDAALQQLQATFLGAAACAAAAALLAATLLGRPRPRS